jgi:hypothetical protein
MTVVALFSLLLSRYFPFAPGGRKERTAVRLQTLFSFMERGEASIGRPEETGRGSRLFTSLCENRYKPEWNQDEVSATI